MCTHMCIYIHTNTFTYMYTPENMHSYTNMHIYAHMPAFKHRITNRHVHEPTDRYTHANASQHKGTYVYTYRCAQIPTCKHECRYTNKHTIMHVCTLVHKQIHICTGTCKFIAHIYVCTHMYANTHKCTQSPAYTPTYGTL